MSLIDSKWSIHGAFLSLGCRKPRMRGIIPEGCQIVSLDGPSGQITVGRRTLVGDVTRGMYFPQLDLPAGGLWTN